MFFHLSPILFSALLIAGELWPRRKSTEAPLQRWLTAGILFACGSAAALILQRYVFTFLPAYEHGPWLRVVAMPSLIAMPATLLVLDFLKYWEHRAYHAIPFLWRLHSAHHADAALDVTTNFLHHPFEGIVSACAAAGIAWALGGASEALFISLVTMQLASIFAHANIALPEWFDRALRKFIVTPDFHRVHHAARAAFTNSNYGNMLPWWDHLFGTHQRVDYGAVEALTLGLDTFPTPRSRRTMALLLSPFRRLDTAH